MSPVHASQWVHFCGSSQLAVCAGRLNLWEICRAIQYAMGLVRLDHGSANIDKHDENWGTLASSLGGQPISATKTNKHISNHKSAILPIVRKLRDPRTRLTTGDSNLHLAMHLKHRQITQDFKQQADVR
eukprot:s1533_g14.t1